MMRLEESLRSAWRSDPALRDLCSVDVGYQRLRLHSPLLGIGKGRCWTDRCPDCACWDNIVSKDIARDIQVVALTWERSVQSMFAFIDPCVLHLFKVVLILGY